MDKMITACILVFVFFAIVDADNASAMKGNKTRIRRQAEEITEDYVYHQKVNGSYKLHRTPAPWLQARLTCFDEGAELASPENDALLVGMSKILLTSRQPPLHVFTGINDLYAKGSFTTIRGTPLSKMPARWAQGEPNNINTADNCLIMQRNGLLLDSKCGDSYPFLCYKRDLSNEVLCDTAESDSASATKGNKTRIRRQAEEITEDYVYQQKVNGSYKLHRTPAPWLQARLTCFDEGAELASPENDALLVGMSKILLTSRQPPLHVFTGINDLYAKGSFTAIRGTPLSKMPARWAQGEPNNINTADNCLIMQRNGLLLDSKCGDSYPFLCYKRDLSNELLCDTADSGYVFEKTTKSCYKTHTEDASWQTGYATCLKEGAYLAILNSASEAKFLGGRIRKDWIWAHIGYSYWRKDLWMTVHGETIEEAGYSTWWPGEPNDYEEERCGSMAPGDGLLVDMDCLERLCPFICEKKSILL